MERILMPKELTAENGAKKLLIGEFFETVYPECLTCEKNCDDCTTDYKPHKVMVKWTTIKAIYAMAVEHLSGPGYDR